MPLTCQTMNVSTDQLFIQLKHVLDSADRRSLPQVALVTSQQVCPTAFQVPLVFDAEPAAATRTLTRSSRENTGVGRSELYHSSLDFPMHFLDDLCQDLCKQDRLSEGAGVYKRTYFLQSLTYRPGDRNKLL